MKRLSLCGLAAVCLLTYTSCGNKNAGGQADATTLTTANTQVDKTPHRKEIKGVMGKELAAKFGIDIVDDLIYDGHYNAYTDATGKEVLQGAFELGSTEDMDAFVKRTAKNDSEEEQMNARFSYAKTKYSGQYVDGVKDGLFKMSGEYYEAGGEATILFDAKTNSCSEATYEGGAEAMCFSFKGKINTCTFAEITKHTEEKECE